MTMTLHGAVWCSAVTIAHPHMTSTAGVVTQLFTPVMYVQAADH